jgi:hypothetical protein
MRIHTVVVLLSLFTLFSACGGGGDDGSGVNMVTALEGLWVSDCKNVVSEDQRSQRSIIGHSQVGSEKRYTENYQAYPLDNCQGTIVDTFTVHGLYEVLNEVDCNNGYSGKCLEIDYSPNPQGSGTIHNVYSIGLNYEPDELLLGDGSSVQRPGDVMTFYTYRRDSVKNHKGQAIVDVYVQDGGGLGSGGVPPAALPGYELLHIDLNESTGGHYIWLYYKVGDAFGDEGVPLREIYTVDEYEEETPYKGGLNAGHLGPVNLNAGGVVEHDPLWLYKVLEGTGPVIRCIVVANETIGQTVYGPAAAEGQYDVVWVEELIPDNLHPPSGPYPDNAQDLNEGESFIFPPVFEISDYIYIGYCVDQE